MGIKDERALVRLTVVGEWILLIAVTAFISVYILSSPYTTQDIQKFVSDTHHDSYYLKIFLVSIPVFMIGWLLMTILLTTAVHKADRTRCTIWYISNIIFIALVLLVFIGSLINGFGLLVLITQILGIVYRIYAVATIMVYVEVLKIPNSVHSRNLESRGNMSRLYKRMKIPPLTSF